MVPEISNKGYRELEFVVEGKPVPQSRPKFSRGHAYDPPPSREYKALVRAAAEEAVIMNHWTIAHKDMPVKVTMVIYKPIANSYPVWYKKAALKGLVAPLKKTGDIENIAKGILDAMSDLVYVDDCQVYSLDLEQRYSNEPKVEVNIKAMFVDNGDLREIAKGIILE